MTAPPGGDDVRKKGVPRQWPTRYRFSTGDQTEASLQLLVQKCFDSRTLLPDLRSNAEEMEHGPSGNAEPGPDDSSTKDSASGLARDLNVEDLDSWAACVWGQYLEAEVPSDPHTQHGIFGTCAALQVLAMRRVENSRILISRSLPTLPGLETEGADSARAQAIRTQYEKKGDTRTTYKTAALLDVALSLSRGERRVVPPRAEASAANSVDCIPSIKFLLDMCLPDGGWPDYDPGVGPPLPANAHATAVALLSLSRCDLDELCGCGRTEEQVWRILERTCSFLLALDLSEQSISTVSMVLTALENFRGILPDEYKLRNSPFSRTLAACRHIVTRWVKYTSSREVLRSLEALDYRSLEMERGKRGKRYQFLFYLPHLLAALAILSSASMRRRTANRQFMRHVVAQVVKSAQETRGEVVPGGRQRVSAVETMWAARLMSTFAMQYQRSRRNVGSRIWAGMLDAYDTFMHPRVAVVMVATLVATGVGIVLWWLSARGEQSATFWLPLLGSILASLVSAVLFSWFVNEKRSI